MRQRISLINKSTGKYRIETIEGREHLVTEMLVIEGDSVMNDLLYPQKPVAEAAHQLDMLPAPDGHPMRNGKPVSAFHPVAINARNFGGFSKNPRVEGKQVITDLAIDLDVANKHNRGRLIVRKIKGGNKVAVSTGLTADIVERKGKVGKRNFSGEVSNIQFDHVAVLLDEQPAGENTYTLNHDRTSKRRSKSMSSVENEVILDVSPFSLEDKVMLNQVTPNQVLSAIKGEPSFEDAKRVVEKAGFQVNQIKEGDVSTYLQNQEEFKTFLEQKQEKRQETVDFIVSNSDMKEDQLASIDEETLESICNSITPKNTVVMNRSGAAKPIELIDDGLNAAVGGH